MTPQDAMDMLVRGGMTRNDSPRLRKLFEKVASTATKNETLRCADYVRDDRGLNWLADDILITGGLRP